MSPEQQAQAILEQLVADEQLGKFINPSFPLPAIHRGSGEIRLIILGQAGETDAFSYLQPNESHLDRVVFPFPHRPSIRKQFYKGRMNEYISFVRQTMQ